jgi:hypothetical protein
MARISLISRKKSTEDPLKESTNLLTGMKVVGYSRAFIELRRFSNHSLRPNEKIAHFLSTFSL